MNTLLMDLEKAVGELSELLKDLNNLVSVLEAKLHEKNLLTRVGKPRRDFNTVIGVDGGCNYVELFGGFYLVIIKTAVVSIGERTDKYVSMRAVIAYDPRGDEVDKAVEETMLMLEVLDLIDAIEKLNIDPHNALVVIDGPIADPPREAPSTRLSRELLEKVTYRRVENLHAERASLLGRLVTKGFLVAGYVKRPSSYRTLASLVSQAAGVEVGFNDALLASLIYSRTGCIVKPQKQPSIGFYKPYISSCKGIDYLYVPVKASIVRIEVAPQGHALDVASFLLNRWGREKHPLPVTLAHKLAHVPSRFVKRAAQIVVSKLASQLVKEGLNNILEWGMRKLP